ncbi:MAG TPA: sigma-70 family RNA polymerase sigma factor [Prolixibacteraceae bacterium]|nr:sigma-70 family RNA polymerase sigma factor [Prolixibacteraceae bacterium]
MTGIEVVNALQDNSSVALTNTMGKERLNIADVIKNQGKRLQGFIRKRVHSREDADDILQDVYSQLVEADRLMKPIDQISAWLFTVARNRITDLYRKKKTISMPESLSENEEESFYGELNELLFDDGSTPETEYLRALVWSELEKALEELPEEQRMVFELTEMKGLSFKAISEQSGVAVNTLISRKRYAVVFLRQQLQLIYDELINF